MFWQAARHICRNIRIIQLSSYFSAWLLYIVETKSPPKSVRKKDIRIRNWLREHRIRVNVANVLRCTIIQQGMLLKILKTLRLYTTPGLFTFPRILKIVTSSDDLPNYFVEHLSYYLLFPFCFHFLRFSDATSHGIEREDIGEREEVQRERVRKDRESIPDSCPSLILTNILLIYFPVTTEYGGWTSNLGNFKHIFTFFETTVKVWKITWILDT